MTRPDEGDLGCAFPENAIRCEKRLKRAYLTSPLPATIDRPGPVGVRNRLGGQRLPERGRRRRLDVGQLEQPAAVPSGVVADFLTNHGSDRARPCRTELDVSLCFAPLLKWALTWWRGDRLALAIYPTLKGDDAAAPDL